MIKLKLFIYWEVNETDKLIISKKFNSKLIVGTGKYKSRKNVPKL